MEKMTHRTLWFLLMDGNKKHIAKGDGNPRNILKSTETAVEATISTRLGKPIYKTKLIR